jgi:hypothetical protein
MSVRFLAALAAAVALAVPAFAQEKPKAGSAEAIIEALKQPANFDAANINDIPLFELLTKLGKQHGITFVIMEEQFRAEQIPDIKEKKPNLAVPPAKNATLQQFLTLTLQPLNATFLVKRGRIEIVTLGSAIDEVRGDNRVVTSDGGLISATLVSTIIKDKPLKDVIASIAEEYDLSVVISPKVGKALEESVSARLLNVPADMILDRLVVAADVRVVRRGNTFLLTTPEHAKELAAERVEQIRQRAEIARLKGQVPFFFPPNLPGLGP